ncbi:MAG: hypothetical protein RLZZ385_2828 [Pseudomonadota bacterium]|jgi:hypothetical protein
MLEFLLAGPNVPYTTAYALLVIIGLFEGIGALIGFGLGSFLDSLLPEVDLDPDIEIADTGSNNALSRLLGWLKVGKVPILVLLVVFLFVFGSIGFALNFMSLGTLGFLFPVVVTLPGAFLLSLPVLRGCAVALAAVIPKDESSSVSLDSLIGRQAVITLGESTSDSPAEARVRDQHGGTHYIMVLAEEGRGPFIQGTPVLLVRRNESHFVAIESLQEMNNN